MPCASATARAIVLLDLGESQAALAGRARRVSIAPLGPRLQAFFDDVRAPR
jgi:hypothetical protein